MVKNPVAVIHHANGIYETSISNLKKGEFFVLHRSSITDDYVNSSNAVWVRDEYDKAEKKYCAIKYNDANHDHLFKPSTAVYFGFTF